MSSSNTKHPQFLYRKIQSRPKLELRQEDNGDNLSVDGIGCHSPKRTGILLIYASIKHECS